MKTKFNEQELFDTIQHAIKKLEVIFKERGKTDPDLIPYKRCVMQIKKESHKVYKQAGCFHVKRAKDRRGAINKELGAFFLALDYFCKLELGPAVWKQVEMKKAHRSRVDYYQSFFQVWKITFSVETRAMVYAKSDVTEEDIENRIDELAYVDGVIAMPKDNVHRAWKQLTAYRNIVENMLKVVGKSHTA